MNLRNPIVLVGVFLALFWVSGFLLTLDRAPRVDDAFVVPTLKSASDVDVDSVVVERQVKGKEPVEYRFARKDDAWTLRQGNQSIKVEAHRLRDLIKEVREAKRDPEVRVSNDPSSYGLSQPQATIVLSGKSRHKDDAKERQWKLFLGNETPEKKYVYASSSDRPGLVFALPRGSVNALFFKNANDLRSKRLFDFSEPAVQSFALTEGKNALEVKKVEGGGWLIVRPNLGYADFEGPPAPKDAPPATSTGGVKELLGAIGAVRVDAEDDFVPPADDTLTRNDLVPGKESLRIQVFSGDAKKPTEETLLVGRRDKDYYYARLASDEGAFKLPAKSLAPIFEAIASPAKLRSPDLSPISVKEADAIAATIGKDEARFILGGEPKSWRVELGTAPATAANGKVVEALLDAVQGRRGIREFKDVAEADAAKVDAELGFDSPRASVSVFLQGVDAGKDAKLKKDAKPAITLEFGKAEADRVWVKRTMAEGPVARIAVDATVLDSVVPKAGTIAYLETVLPKVETSRVIGVDIVRGGKTTSLHRGGDRWSLKDSAGDVPAEAARAEEIARAFSALAIRRWVRNLDAKDDLEPLGLKSPETTVTLTLRGEWNGRNAAGVVGQLGGASAAMLGAAVAALGQLESGGEKVTVKFGKETVDRDDAGAIYVVHSKADRLGLIAPQAVERLRGIDFRDRSTIMGPQVRVIAAGVGAPAMLGLGGVVDAGPIITGRLGRGDAASVKSLRIAVRTPIEQRTFSFQRDAKGGWVDQSGLKEFDVDAARVDAVAELVARFDVQRIVSLTGGPRDDQKLSAKDAAIAIDAVLGDLRPVTVTIGAKYEDAGYFAQISTWPGAVFLIGADRVQPLLRGAEYFAKERLAAE